ncbi:MAG: hypothetical protein IPJ43_03355 [Saprospiraceae bacterium]|nr:hypothetical protein [Saprospiraceae bacterium]
MKKKEIIMHKSEIDSTSEIDLIVIYLKAMVEKIISLVGYTFGIKNLESKKEHKKRVILLIKHLPEKVKLLTYYEFLIEQLSANQLEKLNNYRTGILHKKGIAKNQPQEFYATNDGYKTLVEMFQFLFEQHCKNSLVLIASAALLTDELVKLDKPKFELIEIPIQSLLLELKEIQTRINL